MVASSSSSLSRAGLAITANVILSVILVMLNKQLVVRYQFSFMSLLTGMHFLASLVACIVLVLVGFIRFKPVKNYFSIFRIALVSLRLPACLHAVCAVLT